MATNFPSGLDSLTNPTGSSSLTSPDHATQHADANDAIEALQSKVGVDGSAVTSSLDYKVATSKTVTDKIDPSGASTDQVLKFNGTKFVPATGSSLTASDTPPASPVAGELWYESDTGRTFIRYDSVWVEVGSTATTNVNANDLSGTTLASNVVSSSLTSLGTITNLQATAATINGWTVSQPGLVLIKTQTIGSGVTSVTVTDAFSSAYDNYSITVSGGVAASSEYLYLQLGSATSNYRFSYVYGNLGSTLGTAGTVAGSYFQYVGWANTSMLSADIFIGNPFATKMTTCRAFAGKSGNEAGMFSGVQIDATSFTSFVLGIGAGTMTGGTIRVYGYRNS